MNNDFMSALNYAADDHHNPLPGSVHSGTNDLPEYEIYSHLPNNNNNQFEMYSNLN